MSGFAFYRDYVFIREKIIISQDICFLLISSSKIGLIDIFPYSGYGISAQALTAVLRAHDGRGTQTMLTKSILESLGLPTPDELIGYFFLRELLIIFFDKWTYKLLYNLAYSCYLIADNALFHKELWVCQ